MQTNDLHDIVIIGGGPAGLTAGLYAARARMKAVLLERMGFGGQLLTYEKVDNYPGFPEGIGAFGLGELISAHALKFGLQTRTAEVVRLDVEDRIKTVHLTDGVLRTKTIVIASGASPNKMGVKGERELTGRGVSYCAVCDAPFYRNQEVAVVGGGDTAIEEAIYLTKFAKRVHVIHRRDRLRAMSVIQDRAAQNEKIFFILNAVVTEVQGGNQGVEHLVLKQTQVYSQTSNPRSQVADPPALPIEPFVSELPVSGVFVFVGIQPNVNFVPTQIECNAHGFIHTDMEMVTSVPGVFAAGDVRFKQLRQIVTAVGDGATAAFNAGRYIEEHF